MKKDYYEILGVDKSATDAEIKSAFRRLAKKYHPDNKETGDEAKFKEIGEAYAILSDAQKRKTYDQFGSAAFEQGGPGAGGFGGGFSGFDASDINLDDILNDFFGGGFSGYSSNSRGSSRARRGNDLKVRVPLTFEEAVFGCEKDLKLEINDTCESCHGAGGFGEKTCETCGGHGRVMSQQSTIFGVMQTQHTCPDCHGTGKTFERICSDCRGTGIVRKKKTISITVPEGVDNGYELRMSGKGEAGSNGGSNGDIYLEFEVSPHALYQRDGKDIYINIPLTVTEAILGCKKEIPTLYGNVVLTIPEGTQNGTKLKLKGKGVKIPHSITKGDMYGIVNIIMPTKLNRQQKDLLNELSETTLDDDSSFKNFRKYL